jgi:tetratricopeptide (TPR) repeat protein
MAESLNGLAQAYFRLGNYAAAEHHFQQSLEILEKTLAPDNPNVAMVLGSLATVYRLRENYDRRHANVPPLARNSRKGLRPGSSQRPRCFKQSWP